MSTPSQPMNTVEVNADKACNLYGLRLNGQYVTVSHLVSRDLKDRLVNEYAVYLANDFNMSNRIVFTARSLQMLVRKIERHPYRLVKPAI